MLNSEVFKMPKLPAWLGSGSGKNKIQNEGVSGEKKEVDHLQVTIRKKYNELGPLT